MALRRRYFESHEARPLARRGPVPPKESRVNPRQVIVEAIKALRDLGIVRAFTLVRYVLDAARQRSRARLDTRTRSALMDAT